MENLKSLSAQIIRFSFALLFVLIPLILTPWNYELFEYNKMLMTYTLTAVIMGAWIVHMIASKDIRIRKTPLDIPILLFVLSQLVSALFSMDPHVSWFGYYSRFNGGMLSVFTYVMLYYAFVSNFSFQSTISRFIQTMLITGTVVALYGVAEHFGIDKHLWVQDVQNRVFSTLGQPNWLAAYLVACIPLSMALGIQSCWNIQRIVWNSVAILFFVTLLWTRSRSGLIAFAITDILFFLLLFLQGRPLKGEAFKTFLITHGAFLLIIILNGTYVRQIDDWITIQAWQKRFSKISFQPSDIRQEATDASAIASASSETKVPTTPPLIESGVTDSGDIRKYVWQGAVNIWKSSPKTFFIGSGTETYAFAFYQHKPIGHNLTSEWDFLYNKAHNEYLNFLATTGIFGLGSYLLLIGYFIFWFLKSYITAYKAMKQSVIETREFYISIGLFAGWLSILITNFFGFSVVIVQIFFYLFPAFIFILSSFKKSAHQNELRTLFMTKSISLPIIKGRIISACITFVTVTVVTMIFIAWTADKEFANGYHLSRSGYLSQAYQALNKAIQLNPTEPMYYDEQGTVLATLAASSWEENEATVSHELAKASINASDKALMISPNNVNFWKSRTKLLYALSLVEPDFLKEAIQALEHAVTLSPMDPKMYYNLAILYGQTTQSDKSLSLMKKSIELKPNYREGYFGLYLLYKEKNQIKEAKSTLSDYLTKVDPHDSEFQTLVSE